MKTALVLVDIQNDYFPGGKMELEGAEDAGKAAGRLLKAARGAGLPICHVQHVMTRPGAPFFLPDTDGVKIHASVAPADGERIFVKHGPNSFQGTDLKAHLDELGVERLIIAGMMTHMCVHAITRAAFDFGYTCVVAHDACATRAVVWNGVEVPAAQVHAAFMGALAWIYAKTLTVDEIVEMVAQEVH